MTSDGSTAFTYDVENRLVAASGARTAALRYDPLGRLYEVTPSTGSGGSGALGTTRFLYDGDALVAEYDAAGVRQNLYVHAGGADTPFIWYTATDIRFLHTDQQGSIVATSSLLSGTVVAVNAYDEYGIPRTDNVGRFQYTGQVWLSELGLYYYKARIYSPTLGRFLQTDPVGYQDQFNLYAYVGNDPINRSDPTGERCDAEATVCMSDNYQGNVAGIDVRNNPTTNAAVIASNPDYQNPGRKDPFTGAVTEPHGVIVRNSDGAESNVRQNSQGRDANTGTLVTIHIPPNATAGNHGHLDGTLVDKPRENGGWGDGRTLGRRNPIPTYTHSGNRIGVHDAPNGQVRFQMIQGAMTRAEMPKIQRNLDILQRTLDEHARGRR